MKKIFVFPRKPAEDGSRRGGQDSHDKPTGFDGNGGGGDDGRMEERVKKLETLAEKTGERLTAIERDVAIMKSNYTTKEDLHKEMNAQTWRIIGAMITFGGLLAASMYFIVRNVH